MLLLDIAANFTTAVSTGGVNVHIHAVIQQVVGLLGGERNRNRTRDGRGQVGEGNGDLAGGPLCKWASTALSST